MLSTLTKFIVPFSINRVHSNTLIDAFQRGNADPVFAAVLQTNSSYMRKNMDTSKQVNYIPVFNSIEDAIVYRLSLGGAAVLKNNIVLVGKVNTLNNSTETAIFNRPLAIDDKTEIHRLLNTNQQANAQIINRLNSGAIPFNIVSQSVIIPQSLIAWDVDNKHETYPFTGINKPMAAENRDPGYHHP